MKNRFGSHSSDLNNGVYILSDSLTNCVQMFITSSCLMCMVALFFLENCYVAAWDVISCNHRAMYVEIKELIQRILRTSKFKLLLIWLFQVYPC